MNRRSRGALLLFLCLCSIPNPCSLAQVEVVADLELEVPEDSARRQSDQPYLIVLGIAQDAGFPQAACRKTCCREVWDDPSAWKSTSCLAIVDPVSRQRWIIDCTPNFPQQLHVLQQQTWTTTSAPILDGILVTHAHIGHYAGLMHLGREVIGADHVPVWVMPRMAAFLRDNGPWSQLAELENITIERMSAGGKVELSERVAISPILVPHRDEFSETVGFFISTADSEALFIPDIDKWERWDVDVRELIQRVDVAFLDGTFYADGELPGRDIREIPHPFITESMEHFDSLTDEDRAKVHFIHLNHTNPALDPDSEASRTIESRGFRIAREGMRVTLGKTD